jgi:uncharacterized membrane protein YbhN (UPF0104 family)
MMQAHIGRLVQFLRDHKFFHKLGVLISLTLVGTAIYILYHMLRDINVNDLITALKAKDPQMIALAAAFVAAGYFTLTFYDLFALRTIGRADVPYRAAALAGFTSYSVGHNVGASVLTGGAVRYRIYSAWGLNAVDVAKICFVAGLTFWLGNAAVLGLGISYHPEAASEVNKLPVWFNQIAAILILVALTAYVAWVWKRPRLVGRERWTVTLPGGPLTLLQIVIGIIDLACCSLAMYVLMPNDPSLDFVTVAVIFVSATLLGFASHSPGGLGVFDAAMLVGLAHLDREELLAGMLLFRVLYYLAPFALSIVILVTRELIVGARYRRSLLRPVPVGSIDETTIDDAPLEDDNEATKAAKHSKAS